MRIVLLGSFLLIAVLCRAASAQIRVGGPCSYEDFPGTCRFAGKTNEGASLFTFTGEVRGKQVRLAENPADGMRPKGAKEPCALRFIAQGACTPCLFSIGSCGKEAWELFRPRDVAPAPKEIEENEERL